MQENLRLYQSLRKQGLIGYSAYSKDSNADGHKLNIEDKQQLGLQAF
jgi:hypothetical protein